MISACLILACAVGATEVKASERSECLDAGHSARSCCLDFPTTGEDCTVFPATGMVHGNLTSNTLTPTINSAVIPYYGLNYVNPSVTTVVPTKTFAVTPTKTLNYATPLTYTGATPVKTLSVPTSNYAIPAATKFGTSKVNNVNSVY